jgi:hypothetical protein
MIGSLRPASATTRSSASATWTEIEEVMPLGRLREGYDRLHRALEGKPSRYTAGAAAAQGEDLEIPAFLDRCGKTGNGTAAAAE